MPARVILHIPAKFHADFEARGHLALHGRIAGMIRRRGGTVLVDERHEGMMSGAEMAGDGDLHVVESGWCRGPGWLNAAVAYLPDFWHLDPEGVLADSSLRRQTFDPLAVVDAGAFAEALRDRYSRPRHSRYRQKAQPTAIPEGAIAVFLQGRMAHWRGQQHLPTVGVLRAVAAGAGGRRVLVKAHPLSPELGIRQILAAQAEGLAIEATDANVHDLLAGSAVNVSVNSAVALEGFLHRKPAILFGRSDFAGLVETCVAEADFAPALARALSLPRDHDAMLAWYFRDRCLDLCAPGLEVRVLAAFAAVGFPPERLGVAAG
ncbi:MAG: hypothetical protein JSS08_06125 [Proteobacteria bacterium]|nr:hypothetical protein [Pseudomonadota bacterium]